MNTAIELAHGQEGTRAQVYRRLKQISTNQPNAEWLARMLASRRIGFGAMPERLGLTSRQFQTMTHQFFPGMDCAWLESGPKLEQDRFPERDDLRDLFLVHAADLNPERAWMADILVAGCMGENHLWQDLGLWSREELSACISHNFPALRAKNERDMKWKKFLYRQLCIQEGIPICRSPSCEICDDFKNCFGPE